MRTKGKINREKGIDAIPFDSGNHNPVGNDPAASPLSVSLPNRKSIYDPIVYEMLNGNIESQRAALDDLYLMKIQHRRKYCIDLLPYSRYIKDVRCYLESRGLALDKRLHRRSCKRCKSLPAIVS